MPENLGGARRPSSGVVSQGIPHAFCSTFVPYVLVFQEEAYSALFEEIKELAEKEELVDEHLWLYRDLIIVNALHLTSPDVH